MGNEVRPITTLFMLASADGKISTGAFDCLDFDKDIPNITGAAEGLQQYYDIEQTTDLWSLNTGKVQAKIGVNTRPLPNKTPVSFVVIDNKHLTSRGVEYFCALSKIFVLVTTNKTHPAFSNTASNLRIIYQEKLDLPAMLCKLKEYGCERLTVQSGGMMNGLFLREKLFDYVDFVIAPILVGGKDTPTLIDGVELTDASQLCDLGVLQLQNVQVLKDSYVRLQYKVIS